VCWPDGWAADVSPVVGVPPSGLATFGASPTGWAYSQSLRRNVMYRPLEMAAMSAAEVISPLVLANPG